MFRKEGMSADPEKVFHIKRWPEPRDKLEVKSFLQAVQSVMPYIRVGPKETYSDMTKPLRQLTRHGSPFVYDTK